MFDYLWNFSKFKDVNWGMKNLEFMLLLGNDLYENELMETLLSPKPFSNVMYSISFHQAMDFIEDHIINNGFINDELKMSLLNCDQMIAYSFVGAFLHYTGITETQCDEEDAPDNIDLGEILSLYDRMTAKDVLMISKNEDVI